MFKIKQLLLQKGQSSMLLLLASITLVVTGCTGSENDLGTSIANAAKVTDIPQQSADNYDDNVNGLITGNTLKGWIDDWTTNRPAGITGKLVILQVDPAPEAGLEYIKPDGTNVFTYVSNEWVQTRINGVIETVSMVPDGRSMDTFLATYNIDPVNDMIVCAPASSTSSFRVMKSGRCWYMFRYWGVAKEHLAMLNGGNDWLSNNTNLDASYFAVAGSIPPSTPPSPENAASVKDLPQVNMVLQATFEDVMNVIPATDINTLTDGVFVWDARGTTEYAPMGIDNNFRNQATQGHPNGALELNFGNLLAAGNSWKTKAELQDYMNGEVDAGSIGFVDGTLGGVGSGNAYQQGDVVYTYCETTYRAMITGFATVAILGLPTRFYDGAMTEWTSLNTVVDSSGSAPLPFDSPWRTDLVSVSAFEVHSDPTNTVDILDDPVNGAARPVAPPTIIDAFADSANAIINEDLAYKGVIVEIDTDDTGGGGGALPANPCGG